MIMTQDKPDTRKNFTSYYENISGFYEHFHAHFLKPGLIEAGIRISELKPEKILEIGVGSGQSFPYYPKNQNLTAIDISENMIERAKKEALKYPNVHFNITQMDATKLAFPDASFDLVYAPSVITVVPNPQTTLREISRILKPGGTCLVIGFLPKEKSIYNKMGIIADPISRRYGGLHSNLTVNLFECVPEFKILSQKNVNHFFWYPLSILFELKK